MKGKFGREKLKAVDLFLEKRERNLGENGITAQTYQQTNQNR